MKWLSLLLLAALAVVAYFLLTMPDPMAEETSGLAKAGEVQKIDVAQAPRLKPLSAYSAISDRALFTRERTVKKAPKKQPRMKPRQAPRLMLQALGIAVSEEGFIAIVKNKRTGKISRLRLNEQIEGWELEAITTEGFSFKKDGKEIFVVFKKSGGGG